MMRIVTVVATALASLAVEKVIVIGTAKVQSAWRLRRKPIR